MTRWLVLLLVALSCMAMPASANGEPIVLVIHGGGYSTGSVDDVAAQAAVFDREGFKPVVVDYTLGNIEAGWQDIRAAAASYPADREVFAYGVSAGGGYAAKLAETNLVEASTGNSPLVDLRQPLWVDRSHLFACTTVACREKFSPVMRTPAQPFKAYVPMEDAIVNPAYVLQWDLREPLVETVTWAGPHCWPSPLGWEYDIERAARFFEKHP